MMGLSFFLYVFFVRFFVPMAVHHKKYSYICPVQALRCYIQPGRLCSARIQRE